MSPAGPARAHAPGGELGDGPPPLVALAAPSTAAGASPAHATRHWTEQLTHNLAWNAVADLTARGASLGLALACARALPVPAFGRFAFALSLIQYVWLIGDALANSGYATREVARVRGHDPASARRLKGRIFMIRLAAAAVLTALVATVLWLAPLPADLRGALAGASVFLVAYAAYPDWALRAREDFRGLAYANLASALALLGGIFFLLPRYASAAVATALWSGSFAVASVVALSRLLPAGAFEWRGDVGPLRLHARRSVYFALGAMGGVVGVQAPMLVVGMLASPHDAGLFGAGYRFLLVVINGFSVMWWPLMPVLVRARPGEPQFRETLAAMSRVVLLLGLPTMLAFALWPGELLALAFGPRYLEGAGTLRAAGFVVPLYAATALLEQTSLALGGEGVRARINGLALVLVAAGSVLLVPARGPEGGAIALAATYGLTLLAYGVGYRSVLPWRMFARQAVAPVALAGLLALAWVAARAFELPAVPALASGMAAYVAAVFALRLLPRRADSPAGAAS